MVGGSTYAALELLESCAKLKDPVSLISRLRLDAVLHAFPTKREQGQKGRPRKKGDRLPSLQSILANLKRKWTQFTVDRWYSQGKREVEIISNTCLWYSGWITVPIRWVLIRDPQGKFEPQALLSTNLKLRPVEIISCFVRRWQIEVTFQEVRTHLGVETQRQWSDLAIARTTAALMALFSMVAHGHFMQETGPMKHQTFSDEAVSKGQPLFIV